MEEANTPYCVTPSLVDQFASGWLADNGLAALSMRSGERLEPGEIIELCAGGRSLHELITLLCREQTRIDRCAALWKEALEAFESASRIWQDVPEDGDLVTYHRQQLERLRELAKDRCKLYQPSTEEWQTFLTLHRASIMSDL
jgi:hypothetical protein